jgi:hypothetical protein
VEEGVEELAEGQEIILAMLVKLEGMELDSEQEEEEAERLIIAKHQKTMVTQEATVQMAL